MATGIGLQSIAGIAGMLGTALSGRKSQKENQRIAGGDDPALARVRAALANQNAQTAQHVASSQRGVNPALAQRNAQQALAQAQVGTNATLAQAGLQREAQARGAVQANRQQRAQGAISQGAGLLSALGAQQSVASAQDQLRSGGVAGAPSTGAALPASDLVPQVPNSVPVVDSAQVAVPPTQADPVQAASSFGTAVGNVAQQAQDLETASQVAPLTIPSAAEQAALVQEQERAQVAQGITEDVLAQPTPAAQINHLVAIKNQAMVAGDIELANQMADLARQIMQSVVDQADLGPQ